MTQAVQSIEGVLQQRQPQSAPASAQGTFGAMVAGQAGGTASTAAASGSLQPKVSDIQSFLLKAQAQMQTTGGVTENATSGSGYFTATVAASQAGSGSADVWGYYLRDGAGNPVAGQILSTNTNAGGTFAVTGVDPSEVGFFLIPGGAGESSGLTTGEPVTFKQVDGQWIASTDGGQALTGNGANLLFDNSKFNADGLAHIAANTTVTWNADAPQSAQYQEVVTTAWESKNVEAIRFTQIVTQKDEQAGAATTSSDSPPSEGPRAKIRSKEEQLQDALMAPDVNKLLGDVAGEQTPEASIFS